ncbi:phospholipase D-like domain-containing protein [Christiangramia sp.]|uniref:phospholipase D-like domain-containing protein n=1 Tax=Christiangramia sp. TaxID=1931228 RepID=UPI0026029FB1|nr:phospholipase D-like domain-containing protein [Christiangramia sp.]
MSQEVFFNIRNEIIQRLQESEKNIKIAVAWFTDKKIIQELEKQASNNIKIEIILYHDKINKARLYESLHSVGVDIFYLSKRKLNY